ncbi:MAG: pantoate--beta-alanine ligase [Alphaproteobacteria bacterium]|nr:pantoate--beta-alanine ligase [Alphaproteobacteria bacterium]
MTEIVRTVADLRARIAGWRAGGEKVALVPTMGALHAGHLSLVDAGLSRGCRVVVSIFVNPTQFGPNEDLAKYPRQEAADVALLAERGAHLAFCPSVGEMYAQGSATRVDVKGLTDCLCGAARPGHFSGMATVVTKLLLQALPDFAMFGEKDWQQLQVVRRLVRDLDIPVDIVGCPTIREADGLALSSRNLRLSAADRAIAPLLNREMRRVAEAVAAGGDAATVLADARARLTGAGFGRIDYLEMRHPETLELAGARPARVFAAAYLGDVRLIDNIPV